MENKKTITISATINAPTDKVWELYTNPEHIVKWNHASDDWHTTAAENDIQTGGKFKSRMEANDGSFAFDFEGVYTEVRDHEYIAYEMEDGRKVQILFKNKDTKTEIQLDFDAESENSEEMQREGWQAILDNFKKYVEENK